MSTYHDYIIHIDGDSFFAACEVAQYPHLKGLPVVVGQERGIATAFTYEAKALGITRGMPIFKIKKFFPEVTILPTHFELYKMYSQKMSIILRRYLRVVEDYSIDECFGLIENDHAHTWEEVHRLAQTIKNVLQKETGLTFSVGVGRTKVLAKIASKAQKPDGLTIITDRDEDTHLSQTPIGKVWGIGYRTAPLLKQKGITCALQFRDLPEDYIVRTFAKPLQELWHEMHGTRIFDIGNSHNDPKSLQATRTFFPMSTDRQIVFSELSKNIETACVRMRRHELLTSSITFFVKTSDFKYFGRELRLPFFTDNPIDILDSILPLFDAVFVKGLRYRATGVTLSYLRPSDKCEQDLFGVQKQTQLRGKLMDTFDKIRNLYGTRSIFLGASMHAMTRKEQRNVAGEATAYEYNLPVPFMGEVA
jgi:DNA polymerase-4/DNA polymerase V